MRWQRILGQCAPISSTSFRQAYHYTSSTGAVDNVDTGVRLDDGAHLTDLKGVGAVLVVSLRLAKSSWRLTSKAFCIWPRPNQPRSPPLRALEQSLSVLAILANSAACWSCGRALIWSMYAWICWRASGSERVIRSWISQLILSTTATVGRRSQGTGADRPSRAAADALP